MAGDLETIDLAT